MRKLALYISIFTAALGMAQIGGTKTFRFLDLPIPARANALGGNGTMAIWDDDINLSYSNPALLNHNCNNQFAFNYVNYVADLNYGNFAYAHHFKKVGTFAAGIQYFNYGKFDGRDEYDEQTGKFNAADYSLNLSLSRPISKDSCFSVGITAKTIYSHYDQYYSFGSAFDFGITYHNKHQLTASIVAKNYGKQWRPYSGKDGVKESLPADLQIGISKKIPKAPFRLIAVYDQLMKWDLTYVSPLDEANQIDPFTNEPAKKRTKSQIWGDKFIRHITIASEIIVTKNFNLRVGYNFMRGKEMKLPDKKGVNGLSLGLGFKIYKFQFSYAFSKYNIVGNSHTFSIATSLANFTKK
ncbi:MAG: type IX secretion system protein PorQ [Bacteroidetes bacterium]|nr:type IX secretion system protein PorQ [Bacteroidota bacterium]